jgi:starch synthase
MKIVILTNEYPPNVYGGAGVHVEYLVQELSRIQRDVEAIKVLCFGNQESRHENVQVRGVDVDMQYTAPDLRHPALLNTLIRDVAMTGSIESADIIHCHTWYTHLAGCLLKQLTGGKLVLTTHSLEPHRPWKQEQLGTAYNVSSWMEKTAYENADGVIAVSQSMRRDVLKLYGIAEEKIRVIHNGIDTEEYRLQSDPAALKRYGINAEKPFILFVGRITRQKGILHLVNAIPYIRSDIQIVLCAGAADTREIEQEMSMRIAHSQERSRNEIIWIPKVVPKPDIISIYSAAALFVCPSIYEPFGIINLEAMACSTPVVASAVGGIPEIVIPEETGLLVRFASVGSGNPEPEDPDRFSRDLASAIDSLLQDPEKIHAMGKKARERVEEHFSWKSIALQTLDFYQQLLQSEQ